MLVFGAFYFLVPTLLGKSIYSQRLAELTWILMTVGAGIFRGTIDIVLDAVVLGGASVIFLVHAIYTLMGTNLSAGWLDALI